MGLMKQLDQVRCLQLHSTLHSGRGQTLRASPLRPQRFRFPLRPSRSLRFILLASRSPAPLEDPAPFGGAPLCSPALFILHPSSFILSFAPPLTPHPRDARIILTGLTPAPSCKGCERWSCTSRLGKGQGGFVFSESEQAWSFVSPSPAWWPEAKRFISNSTLARESSRTSDDTPNVGGDMRWPSRPTERHRPPPDCASTR